MSPLNFSSAPKSTTSVSPDTSLLRIKELTVRARNDLRVLCHRWAPRRDEQKKHGNPRWATQGENPEPRIPEHKRTLGNQVTPANCRKAKPCGGKCCQREYFQPTSIISIDNLVFCPESVYILVFMVGFLEIEPFHAPAVYLHI